MDNILDTAAPTAVPADLTGERADLLEALRKQRWLFRFTVQGLTDEQARLTPTASELSPAGLIKHVTQVEKQWATFVTDGPAEVSEADYSAFRDGFRMGEDETLDGLLAAYDEVAAATDAMVASVDLDADHPLPEAPWFEPGARWSARRVFLQVLSETAQHAGHADILRESIDGQKSMG